MKTTTYFAAVTMNTNGFRTIEAINGGMATAAETLNWLKNQVVANGARDNEIILTGEVSGIQTIGEYTYGMELSTDTIKLTAENVLDKIDPDMDMDLPDIRAVLEDGEALAALGFDDDDQMAIEEAHASILKLIAYWSE